MNRFFRSYVAFAVLMLSFPALGQLDGGAASEWIALGRNENLHVYLDQRSVEHKDGFARVYQLSDFATAQWIDERTVVGSIRALVEYDCTQFHARTLALEAYSEQMAEGRLITREQNPDAEWEELSSGGTGESAWRLVCKE